MAWYGGFGKAGDRAPGGLMAFSLYFNGPFGAGCLQERSRQAITGFRDPPSLQAWRGSILQLAFEPLDFLGEGAVIAGEIFDLADRMQDRSVIPAAETATDFRQRA